jgi:hypothetical protein
LAVVLRDETAENVVMIERRGDYGHDAPYALVTLAALGAGSAMAAIVAWWAHRGQALPFPDGRFDVVVTASKQGTAPRSAGTP